jgi:hypothetical protein
VKFKEGKRLVLKRNVFDMKFIAFSCPLVSFEQSSVRWFATVGCNTLQLGKCSPTFQRNVPPPVSGAKIEAILSFETSVSFYRVTLRHIQGDNTFHSHRSQNLIPNVDVSSIHPHGVVLN